MSALILNILSILGIILLTLLALVLIFALLVLFFPVKYRIWGEKKELLQFRAGAFWFFGLLTIRYIYPEPGNMVIKFLWFTLFDSKAPKRAKASKTVEETKKKAGKHPSSGDVKEASGDTEKALSAEAEKAPGNAEKALSAEAAKTSGDAEHASSVEIEKTHQEEAAPSDKSIKGSGTDSGETVNGIFDKIKRLLEKKYEKIRYTFCRFYDKIKQIWENISYYKALLEEEETALLFGHVKMRLGKLIKSLRPRKLRANILFGTGSPDTTGYAYGLYGMLSPALGPHVAVTPDFEQARLEGDFYAAGHITMFHFFWHGGMLLLNKKLHLFLKKLRGGKNGR